MKEITIGKKTYELHYGLDFIREMDKRYGISGNGIHFGAGIQSALYYLGTYNPVILQDIILSATHTLKSIPSKKDIEEWIFEQPNLDAVFTDFLKSLETAPATKLQIDKLRAEVEQ
ncbi:TPA: tail assembly chaperone [Streptococcus suis]